jgi:hypothetical protein
MVVGHLVKRVQDENEKLKIVENYISHNNICRTIFNRRRRPMITPIRITTFSRIRHLTAIIAMPRGIARTKWEVISEALNEALNEV